MEWKKLVKREHKDLEKIMKRELNLFRNQDIDFYNILESNYEDLKYSLFKNDSLTKELIKIIKTMKKAKIDDLDEYAEDTDESFRSMIRLESNAIANSRDNYLSNRESLVSLFSQVDKNLLFIKQGVIQYQSVLPDLKFKKIKIEQSLDRYMNVLNEVLFDKENSEYSAFIIDASKKIEKWLKQMNAFETFLENIEPIARKELGGFVVLKPVNSDPPKYVERFKKGLIKYNENIENIYQLVKTF